MGIILGLYVALILAAAPWLAWKAADAGVIRSTPRPVLYRSMVATSWLMATVGGSVLWWDGTLSPGEIGLGPASPVLLILWSGGTLAAALAGFALFAGLRRALGLRESADLLHVLPRTPGERRVFPALALTAGITEEFVFRGICITALAGLLPGGPWVAAAVVSISFGLSHGYQDRFGMLRAGGIGFVLAVPFLVTGSLVPGMVAHTLVDLSPLVLTPPAEETPAPGRGMEEGSPRSGGSAVPLERNVDVPSV